MVLAGLAVRPNPEQQQEQTSLRLQTNSFQVRSQSKSFPGQKRNMCKIQWFLLVLIRGKSLNKINEFEAANENIFIFAKMVFEGKAQVKEERQTQNIYCGFYCESKA